MQVTVTVTVKGKSNRMKNISGKIKKKNRSGDAEQWKVLLDWTDSYLRNGRWRCCIKRPVYVLIH